MDLPAEVVLRVLHRGLTPEATAKLLQEYSDILKKIVHAQTQIGSMLDSLLSVLSLSLSNLMLLLSVFSAFLISLGFFFSKMWRNPRVT